MAYSNLFLVSRTPREIARLASLEKGEIATGHAGFDRAANHPSRGHVGTGNVVSAVQRSTFVRAHSETRCNGFVFTPGEFQKHDLEMFRHSMPANVMASLRQHARARDVIAYDFFPPGAGARRVVHGWVITDTFYRRLETVCAPRQKSIEIMGRMQARVSWSDRDATDPVRAEAIAEAAQGIGLDDLRALAAAQGWAVTWNRETCIEQGSISMTGRRSWRGSSPIPPESWCGPTGRS